MSDKDIDTILSEINELLSQTHSSSISHIINCAGPDRGACNVSESRGIKERIYILDTILTISDYFGCNYIIHLSSIHVFGGVNLSEVPANSFACPSDNYGLSHFCGENYIVNRSAAIDGKEILIIRLPNLFGKSPVMPNTAKRLVGNDLIFQAMNGHVSIRSLSNSIINLFPLTLFCEYVREVLENDYFTSEVRTISPPEEISIMKFVSLLSTIFSFKISHNISNLKPEGRFVRSDIDFGRVFWTSFFQEVRSFGDDSTSY